MRSTIKAVESFGGRSVTGRRGGPEPGAYNAGLVRSSTTNPGLVFVVRAVLDGARVVCDAIVVEARPPAGRSARVPRMAHSSIECLPRSRAISKEISTSFLAGRGS